MNGPLTSRKWLWLYYRPNTPRFKTVSVQSQPVNQLLQRFAHPVGTRRCLMRNRGWDGSMRNMLKRLWRDRRGNALVIAAAALPLVVGSAGLASDTIQWVVWKRQLQKAADSAALAGVYARAQGQTLSAAVATDLAKNNHLWVPLKSGYPVSSAPADTGQWTYLAKVDLAVQQRLAFSSLFMSAAPTITVSATAAMIPEGSYCVVALQRNTDPGIVVGGSSNVNMGCGAISNSQSPTSSVSTNGNSYNFTADPIAAVGGMPSSIIGATDLQPYHVALPDPFAGKYDTTVPAGTNCQNFAQKNYTTTTGTGQDRVTVQHLQAGCYNNFGGGNDTYYLDPGVYYLNNTDLSLTGQTILVGTDVTIIMTGTSPGSVSMSGNSEMRLAAPATGPFAKMLFIQSPNATNGNNNIINGSSASSFDGAFYFPNGDLEFSGTSAGTTQCAMVVSLTVTFQGSSTLQNDTSTCTADQTVSAKMIRLIA